MKISEIAYSYKTDKAVPEFDDSGPVTVMDAHCSLCAKGASWIARNDKVAEFHIIPLQSELGVGLMKHFGLNPDDPLSWLYLENGYAYQSLDAYIRVGQRLGGLWNVLGILNILPRSAQNLAYGLVARNRYKLFGRTDLCSLPDPEVKKRLLL